MGRRYYCEFCDKSFADNPTNKKNHLKGVFHQRMKKLHYDAFREPEVILKEEMLKMPCRRFENTGECQYGDNCRYSHLTPERRQHLQAQIQAKKEAAVRVQEEGDKEVCVEEWLSQREKSGSVPAELAPSRPAMEPAPTPVYMLPPALLMIPNLPPSLLPPPSGVVQQDSQAEWG